MEIPADVQAVIVIVRVVGPEFADVPDDVVAQWVIMGREFLHDPENYKSWNMAQAYMACHTMWLNGLGITSTGGGGGNQQTAGAITKYKAGNVEIQYANTSSSTTTEGNDSGNDSYDEWLEKTTYGEALMVLDIGGMGGLTRWG